MQIKSRANKLDFATAAGTQIRAGTQTMTMQLGPRGLQLGLRGVRPGKGDGTQTGIQQIHDVMMSRWDLDFSMIHSPWYALGVFSIAKLHTNRLFGKFNISASVAPLVCARVASSSLWQAWNNLKRPKGSRRAKQSG